MKKSNFKKTKLASVLLLSTVLLPNIAYAEDDVENEEQLEVQLFNEESSTLDEQDQSTLNDDNNTDIDIGTPSNNDSVNDDEGALLIPADPEDESENTNEDIIAEPEAGEEETPDGGAVPEVTDPEPEEPGTGEEDLEEPEIPEIPTEPIEPVEPPDTSEPTEPEMPTEPETPVEPELPVEPEFPTEPVEPELPVEPFEPEIPYEPDVPDNEGNEENVEETESSTEEETMGTGSGPKKLYRYNHGDILNGITFDYNNIEEDMATLDQRVTRVMSSQIIEEKDLMEEQKEELEEASKVTPHGAKELPDTGEADASSYGLIGLMAIVGGLLIMLSKKLRTDN